MHIISHPMNFPKRFKMKKLGLRINTGINENLQKGRVKFCAVL